MRVLYDFKQSFQCIYRDYEYSVTVIVTMALTLAISLFLFTMVYSIQYKPLPQVDAPKNIAWGTLQTGSDPFVLGGLSNHTYEYIKQHQTTLEHFGRIEQRGVTLSNAQLTEQSRGAAVSHELFQLLGVSALKGRVLLANDDMTGAQKNVVISFRLWDTLFNKSEDIIGQTIKLDGAAASIVGVMPEAFRFPTNHDVWFTDAVDISDGALHGGWNSAFGRLKPNVQMADVEEEFSLLAEEIKKDYPDQYKGKEIAVVSFTDRFSGNMGFLLSLLKIASIVILLMGCFSVSNLIIVRNLENAKEVLIKTALGVPITRVVASLLLETFWLCLIAAIIGIWLCFLVIHYFGESLLDGPYWWTLEFEAPILLSGVVAAVLIWISTGVIPLWMAARQPTNGLLSSGRKGGTGTALSRIMVGLSTLQVLSAFILTVFTGVLIGGLIRLANADYGVPRDGYLTAEVKVSGPNYATLEQRNRYYDRFIERALQTSGVQGGAVSNALPGSWGFLSNYTSIERTIEIGGAFPKSNEMPISDTYFPLMEIRLIEGRNFNAADKEGAEEVAIINQTMANILFPGESAAGRQFQYDPESGGMLLTVVGVVPDVVSGNPLWYLSPESEGLRSQLYRPITQKQPEWDSNTLVFRTDRNPHDLITDIKAIARDIDAEIPLFNLKSYDEFLAENESGFRKLIYTFTPAALLALVISALGIYSITRRVVLQSTPDIGIMRAIGIEERFIDRKYIGSSVIQLAVSLTIGVIFALVVLPKLPDSILITNIYTILSTCAIVAVVIGLLVMVASYLPLLAAHKMSPRDAMNYLSLNSD